MGRVYTASGVMHLPQRLNFIAVLNEKDNEKMHAKG